MSDPPGFPAGPPELRAGAHRLEQEIARGGFGVVFRATHVPSGEPRAVKVLHADLGNDPSSTARFEREAAVVRSLAHPGIVRIHEHGRIEDGRPFFAMELLAGESLAGRLRKAGRLGVEETLDILAPLAGALAAAHARGVVHRDVKPSNVFLAEARPAGPVVLLDFGVVKLLGDDGPALTRSRAVLGTIPFMAPEQISGHPVDARADVYALAAVVYSMLTGDAPFGARPVHVLRQMHLHARPEPPSRRAPVDPALDEPLLAALAPEPDARPPSAPAFVDSLHAALRRGPLRRAPAPEGARERPALAVLATVRADPAALDAGDERLLDALEASLSTVRAELSAAGLVPVRETAAALLAVSPGPPDAALIDSVLAACIRSYRRAVERAGGERRMDLGLVAHAAALHTGEEGAILPSGLLDTGSWAPAGLRGVAASGAALGGAIAQREPVAGAPGFFWVERGGPVS